MLKASRRQEGLARETPEVSVGGGQHSSVPSEPSAVSVGTRGQNGL